MDMTRRDVGESSTLIDRYHGIGVAVQEKYRNRELVDTVHR